MNVVALIPARSGSKRLPGKNLAPLAGRPLLAYTCIAARDAGVLAAMYVNTDDACIAAVAAEYGVACPALRPARLAADETPTRDANLFLLDVLARRGEHYDAVMVLQPTSPLRTAADIRAAWRLFAEQAGTVDPVEQSSSFALPNAAFCAVVSVSPVAPRGWLGLLAPDGALTRWAGTEPVYRLNGAIYVHAVADYLADRPPARTLAYVMPAERGVDVDTAADLAVAEALLSRSESSAHVE